MKNLITHSINGAALALALFSLGMLVSLDTFAKPYGYVNSAQTYAYTFYGSTPGKYGSVSTYIDIYPDVTYVSVANAGSLRFWCKYSGERSQWTLKEFNAALSNFGKNGWSLSIQKNKIGSNNDSCRINRSGHASHLAQ